MKRFISGVVISALAVVGGAVIGETPAFAATTSTVVLTGGSGVLGLDPAIITATASSAGTVAFKAVGVVIVGCESVATTTVTPFVAKCSWVPKASGSTLLGATFTPTDAATFTTAEAGAFTVKVGVAVQGVVSPIHLYVDTVLASGSTGVLAARFGVSCAITSQFIVGQTIVWRVYGNNETLGGAVMDSSNTVKGYIEVAGVKDPLPLTYGNHSGVAFWTAVLKTGTATGLYNTLGVISYKVTMIAKDQDSIKVLSTKLTRKAVNGVPVKVDGQYVYERVPAYKTVKVTPALKGAVGTWQSNFTASSLVTLYAVPTA
ncbi:unannotated protein [freshwater metagenome]|jgi:hypothetical protein|uniref:Unannotated protein n=1 Tax=freshwater metagenome TaxID=449393 RepID=A0A6J7AGF2_9ZZZZ|nr:hypothetical protein [Actinomycetota bacterium]MSW57587.1 hypothetical protein [Actinomycetota bacterium]MSX48610.1 hypothetical protein [Actinomycetota bacterium]MSX62732.1 hypothetical protein [Actinomycetota bacterium]MSY55129.1 hypothetical protein [Actinomycetota bacterium]